MDSIDVRIFEGGRLTLEGQHPLPVTIGRGSCTMQVASPDRRISRVHVTVSERGGALVLADSSGNGTTYHGRFLHEAETTIADADEFAIEQYRVEIRRVRAAKPAPPPPAKPPPPPAKHAPPASTEPAAFYALVHTRSRDLNYAIGPSSLVLLLEEQRAQAALVHPRDPAMIFAKAAAEGREALAVIAAKDGFGTITTTPASVKRGLLINRGAPSGATERLRPLDVVSLGHMRIEILEKDQRALRCKNHECQLLNPYDADENCRFCGHRLVEAQTTFATG